MQFCEWNTCLNVCMALSSWDGGMVAPLEQRGFTLFKLAVPRSQRPHLPLRPASVPPETGGPSWYPSSSFPGTPPTLLKAPAMPHSRWGLLSRLHLDAYTLSRRNYRAGVSLLYFLSFEFSRYNACHRLIKNMATFRAFKKLHFVLWEISNMQRQDGSIMNPHHPASQVTELSFLLLNDFLQMNAHDWKECNHLGSNNLQHLWHQMSIPVSQQFPQQWLLYVFFFLK